MSKTIIRTVALSAPIIWFLNHAALFALAPLACAWRSNSIVLIVSACALALDAICGMAAWSALREAAHETMPPWLAMSGVALSGGFFLVILAQTLPNILMPGCV